MYKSESVRGDMCECVYLQSVSIKKTTFGKVPKVLVSQEWVFLLKHPVEKVGVVRGMYVPCMLTSNKLD